MDIIKTRLQKDYYQTNHFVSLFQTKYLIFIKHANANSTNLNEIKNFETWQCKYDIKRSPTKDRVFFELDKINLHHINVKTKDWILRDHYMNRMFFQINNEKNPVTMFWI